MTAILQTTFSNAFSVMKIYNFYFYKFVPKSLIDNIYSNGLSDGANDKPLSEPMMVR